MSEKIYSLWQKVIHPLLFGFIGAALIIHATSKYGPALSHDSAAYLFASETLLDGKGLLYFGYDTPFVQWPPGFSLLLALFGKRGAELVSLARYINSAAFGVLAFLSSRWLVTNLKNYFFALLGSLAILFSIPLLSVYKYVWSEPVFLVFILLFLFTLERYISTGRRFFLLLSAAFTCFACLTRYMGTAAVLAAGLVLLVSKRKWKRKVSDLVLYGAVSLVPLGLWFLRNYMVFSTLTGVREPSQMTAASNIELSLKTLASWLLPFPGVPEVYAGMLLCAAFILSAIFLIKDIKNNTGAVLMILFSVLYTACLVASASVSAFDPIGTRLLSPAYVPVILLLFFLVDRIYTKLSSKGGIKVLAYAGAVLAGVWVIYMSANFFRTVDYMAVSGAGGYSDGSWVDSGLTEYAAKLPEDCTIYSNYPDVIYLFTGRHAMYPPKKNDGGVYEYGLERFKAEVSENSNSYFLWYDRGQMTWFYNIEETGRYFSMEQVTKAGDGVVYRIK
jgi:hypothetical protein